MIIDPDGLFNGDRLRKCSNAARLFWPYFMLASNGYGRLELNYHKIVAKCFSTFNPVPSQKAVEKCLKEYADNFLLFEYQAGGQRWGQWDCDEKLLTKYKTSADKRSPNPPEDLLKDFRNRYLIEKTKTSGISESLPKSFEKVSEKLPENFPLGVGVGVGIGEKKNPADEEDIPPSAAATAFMMECRVSGKDVHYAVTDAITLRKRIAKVLSTIACEQLIAEYNQYKLDNPDPSKRRGVKNWLAGCNEDYKPPEKKLVFDTMPGPDTDRLNREWAERQKAKQ